MRAKKPRYLGSKSNVKSSPDSFILDCVNNPHLDHDYSIRFIAPEFTSICPITSQPDFGKIIIDYVPNKLLMESKSFKLFLFSFRDYGGFHEDCTIKISKKIIKYVKPKWIRVASFWNPRGGIPIDIISQTGKKPANVIVSELNIPIYGNR